MIRVESIKVRIDGQPILNGADFSIAKGESVALVGPNGSGKTTVLRAILGLVPFEGKVIVGGIDALQDPIAVRTLLGYLPQKPCFGNATAKEVLRFAMRLRRGDLSKIDGVLERVGLLEAASRPARSYSGGMQQRLSFALALLCDAPALLLDEPTASLDREGQASFAATVQQLRSEGRTLLLALHRAEEIDRLADRTLSLEGGLVIDETPSQTPAKVLRLRSEAV